MNSRRGLTLVEMMIVVLVIAVLTAIAIPNFITSRAKARAGTCNSNLRQIAQAKDQFAMIERLGEGADVYPADLSPDYLRGGPFPICPTGGTYTVNPIGEHPTCSLSGSNPPHVYP